MEDLVLDAGAASYSRTFSGESGVSRERLRIMDMKLKTIVYAAALALAVAGAPEAAVAKNKFERELDKEKEAIKLAKETIRGGYGLISTAEVKELIDSDSGALIVDAMPYGKSYKNGHVPTAVNFLFPVSEMAEWDEKETGGKGPGNYEALLGPDKERKVVVYCGFVKCGRSHNAATWAVKLGYKNVLRHPGGIYAWKGAGYRMERAK